MCYISLKMDIFYWRFVLKCSFLYVLWWRGYYCIYLWYADFICLPWLVVLLLALLFQCLESINLFYLLQLMLIYMGCYFLTGIHRACCYAHSIGKLYKWEYLLVEILVLTQINNMLWRDGLRDNFLVSEGNTYLWR